MAEVPRLLFVDDDEAILRTIARLLRGYESRWEMIYVVGGRAAVELLRHAVFDIVVTDCEMPIVDGAAVLAAVRQYSPHARRIVISGRPDAAAAVPDAEIAI